MSQVAFSVEGLPPTKNEAKSMLAIGHGQAARVVALLQAASNALSGSDFPMGTTQRVGLDLTVYAPAGARLPDATNFLGGIGDVLESKVHRGALEHLGALAEVALYQNDSQIREVHYRQEASDHIHYQARIWILGDAL
jgi:hypothetical protein